jgi:hypothetical protein
MKRKTDIGDVIFTVAAIVGVLTIVMFSVTTVFKAVVSLWH